MEGVVLTWKMKPAGDGTEVLLEGDISEDADLDSLRLTSTHVVFDFAKIRHINSEGLRRLVNHLRRMSGGCKLEAKRCAVAIVEQLNLVPELSRLLVVRSLFVPMECPGCLAESEVLVDVAGLGGPPVLPPHKCKGCGGAMELSEPSERYFAFLSD